MTIWKPRALFANISMDGMVFGFGDKNLQSEQGEARNQRVVRVARGYMSARAPEVPPRCRHTARWVHGTAP